MSSISKQQQLGISKLFTVTQEDNKSSLESLANEIMKTYPKGIDSIVQTSSPQNEEPYVIMILNCPEDFSKRYGSKDPKVQRHYAKLNLVKDIIKSSPFEMSQDEEMKLMADKTEESYGLLINSKISETISTLTTIKSLFENISSLSNDLINLVIKKYIQQRTRQIPKEEEPTVYEQLNRIYQTMTDQKDSDYYYLNFSDLLIILCSLLNFYTGLSYQISFTDHAGLIMLNVYGNEETYDLLAEYIQIHLKLKAYAMKFQRYYDNISNEGKPEDQEENYQKDIEINLLNKKKWTPIKYSNLDLNDPMHWPPYYNYDRKKDEKYQRYNKDDSYHDCNVNYDTDEICSYCSKFRNIDKLRLIYASLDKVLKISNLTKGKILNQIIFKRNNEGYKTQLSFRNIVLRSWNLFDKSSQMEWISNIRNFYGETVSYYFLWLIEMIKWTVIPSFIGIIISIATNVIDYQPLEGIDAYEILMLGLCFLITVWASFFLRAWRQNETVYNYIWGMDSYRHNEPDSESFVPEGTHKLIFNHELPYVSSIVKKTKQFLSYLFLLLMGVITCGIVYFLFWLKKETLAKYSDIISPGLISMTFAMSNAIQIKVMSSIYTKLSIQLTEWENHQKDYQKMNAYTMKKIIFDFINSYNALFYIAFLKPLFNDHCMLVKENDIMVESCLAEMKIQLYTTYFMNIILLNIFEISIPYCHMNKQKKQVTHELNQRLIEEYKGKVPQEKLRNEICTYSLEHQLMCDSWTNAIADYTEMIIAFGYICLFSVAAPLTPVIVLIWMYLEKFIDSYKIAHLVRVDVIEGTTGIEKYKKIIQGLIYIGMLTNVALVVFVDNNFLGNDDISKKALVYAVVEILIFVLSKRMKIDTKPYWFENLNDIKDLYDKEYYQRNMKALPHFEFIRKK